MKTEDYRLVTRDQLADMLGVSPRHVVRKASSGAWPSLKVANTYKFTREHVKAIFALLETKPEAASKPEPRKAPLAVPKPRRRAADRVAAAAAAHPAARPALVAKPVRRQG
ncbi:MAG: helix-turn-helix domain-containing protein [Thermobispora bispora]|nr:helix-turn-helix domain-containing protein [Thermobispora bispora]